MDASQSRKGSEDWAAYFNQCKISREEAFYRAEHEKAEIRLMVILNISRDEFSRVIGIRPIESLDRLYEQAARGELAYNDGALHTVPAKTGLECLRSMFPPPIPLDLNLLFPPEKSSGGPQEEKSV